MLSESNVVSMSNRFSEVIWRASQRFRPHDEGKSDISDFISAGNLGSVLQDLGGNLSLKKVKNIPPLPTYASTGYLTNIFMAVFIQLDCKKQASWTTLSS